MHAALSLTIVFVGGFYREWQLFHQLQLNHITAAEFHPGATGNSVFHPGI